MLYPVVNYLVLLYTFILSFAFFSNKTRHTISFLWSLVSVLKRINQSDHDSTAKKACDSSVNMLTVLTKSRYGTVYIHAVL